MDFKHHVIQSVIDIVTLGEKNDRIGRKKNKKNPAKNKWEIPAVIALMPMVGVKHC